MSDNEYQLLDTQAFTDFLSSKEDILRRYNDLNSSYENAISRLLSNWEGRGADAFADDSAKVRTNINGIYDILKLMCDTLTDCLTIFDNCDTSLGESNRDTR